MAASASSSSAAFAAAAQCHYRAGRYSRAAVELRRWEEEDRKDEVGEGMRLPCPASVDDRGGGPGDDDDNDDDVVLLDEDDAPSPALNPATRRKRRRRRRAEFLALPPLARAADLALCRFRSSAAKGRAAEGGASPPDLLWRDALRANASYRRALSGAAASLARNRRKEVDARRRRRTADDADGGGRARGSAAAAADDDLDFGRDVRSTAVAALMAGVAAAHLLLHRAGDSDAGFEGASEALADATALAAGLVHFAMREGGGFDAPRPNSKSKGAPPSSPLEEDLAVLDEALCRRPEGGDGSGNDKDSAAEPELERAHAAMQTFRSALKAAALAGGRPVLSRRPGPSGEGRLKGEGEEKGRPSKRRRTRRGEDDVEWAQGDAGSDDEEGSHSWSAQYLRSGPASRSRDRLLDALSFHAAAGRNAGEREALLGERDRCLEEATEWEDRAGALGDADCAGLADFDCDDGDGFGSGGESSGCGGYARRIATCLRVLDSLSSGLATGQVDARHGNGNTGGGNRSGNGDINGNDSDEGCGRDRNSERKEALRSLEILATSTSSRHARDLLGTLRARSGDFAGAIGAFRSSLDRGEAERGDGDGSLDVDARGGRADRRTVSNMALCFAALEDAEAPLELLLHLWDQTSSSSSSGGQSGEGGKGDAIVLRPAALLLSPEGSELESPPEVEEEKTSKASLLWKLFHASSLAEDWGTCLDAAEELSEVGTRSPGDDEGGGRRASSVDLARAFALLQCRRPSAALGVLGVLGAVSGPRPRYRWGLFREAVADLYRADALLQDEADEGECGEGYSPLECARRATDALEAVLGATRGEDNRRDGPLNPSARELVAAAHNDRGLALLAAGDAVGALRHLREATGRAALPPPAGAGTLHGTFASTPWLLLQTHFNLSLLLFRDGRLDESAEVWLRARGNLPAWRRAMNGEGGALSKLRDLRAAAAERRGLLTARRGVLRQGDDSGCETAMWGREEPIAAWTPPDGGAVEVREDSTRLGGVEASQVAAMDELLLRYAMTRAEKKASATFRRAAGNIGY